MSAKLPGWVVDDVTSVREEVADWIGMSAADLWRLARLCARDAMWAASLGGQRERILTQVDPLPQSTLDALERLRRQTNWGDAGR